MPELTDGQIEDTAELLRNAGKALRALEGALAGRPGARFSLDLDAAGLLELTEQMEKQRDRLLQLLQPDNEAGMFGPTWIEVRPEPGQQIDLPPGARIAQADVKDGLLNAFCGVVNGQLLVTVAHARSAVMGPDGLPPGRTPTIQELNTAYRHFFPPPSLLAPAHSAPPVLALLVIGREPSNMLQMIGVNVDFHGAQSQAMRGIIGGQ
jgi:hypothetical protein